MDNETCPCCGIAVADLRQQVCHTERCHPELLRERWQGSGMTPEEIQMHARLARANHPPLENFIDECTGKGWAVNVMAAPGQKPKVSVIPADRLDASGEGETVSAALFLAIDRIQYGNDASRPSQPDAPQGQ